MSSTAVEHSVDSVVDAYHRFRAADLAMTLRIRSETGLSDNEIAIVRFLLREKSRAHEVKPSEIARHLSISSASTTALLDRLERAGMVERVSHPTDRRSILIAATDSAATAVASTVDAFDQRLIELSEKLDPRERDDVVNYLMALADAADATARDGR